MIDFRYKQPVPMANGYGGDQRRRKNGSCLGCLAGFTLALAKCKQFLHSKNIRFKSNLNLVLYN